MATTNELERESPLHAGVKLPRKLPVFYASFFYAFPMAISWIWLEAFKPGRTLQLWATPDRFLDLLAGVAAGLLGAGISAVLAKKYLWGRKLESEFGWILGGQRIWEIAWIAILSGCAEEFLFRGALQEKFGIWVSTAVFAVIHWPLNPNFRAWPVVAAVAGLAFAGLKEWTDSLIAPAAAHVFLNFVNLLRITKRYRDWDEERVAHWVESGT